MLINEEIEMELSQYNLLWKMPIWSVDELCRFCWCQFEEILGEDEALRLINEGE
jgi:hypothetical protein